MRARPLRSAGPRAGRVRAAVGACALAWAAALPVQVLAGGYNGPSAVSFPACSDARLRGAPAGSRCITPQGKIGVTGGGAVVYELDRAGRRCPYPHRPSDSVFLNGAGYLVKDVVRRRLGCS